AQGGILEIALYAVARNVNGQHLGEAMDPEEVGGKKCVHRLFTHGVAVTRFTPGEHDAGGHSLNVPLPWTAEGLIEIIHIEDDLGVGRGEKAEVVYMSVASQLHFYPGVLGGRQVSGHDFHSPAKKREQRERHALKFDRNQLGYTALAGFRYDFYRIKAAGARAKVIQFGAAQMLALRPPIFGRLLSGKRFVIHRWTWVSYVIASFLQAWRRLFPQQAGAL